jgi:hypothetical protein
MARGGEEFPLAISPIGTQAGRNAGGPSGRPIPSAQPRDSRPLLGCADADTLTSPECGDLERVPGEPSAPPASGRPARGGARQDRLRVCRVACRVDRLSRPSRGDPKEIRSLPGVSFKKVT